MAKRLTAFVVDVGPGMREREADTEPGDPTPLEKTVSDLVTILQRKIFSEEGKSESTKSEVCVVLFGTDDTENPLADQDPNYYRNITLSRRLTPVTWEVVDHVTNEFPSSESEGDFLEAIVVAVDHLREMKESLGAKKQCDCDVVVFSNLRSHFGDSQLDDVIAGLTKMDIALKMIGPQFDGLDDTQRTKHARGKMKTNEQKENEEMIQQMIRRGVAGGVWSFEDMATVISNFQSRMKLPRPMHYTLELGTSFAISVSLFSMVMKTKANDGRPWKDFYAKDPEKTVQRAVSYVLDTESRDEVTKEDRVRMWAYGSRLVPITDEELQRMAQKPGEKALKLLGFTSLEEGVTKIPPYVWIGDSVKLVLPRKDDAVAARSYQSLIRSMIEQNVAMILRYVYQARSKARLVLGVPIIRHASEFDASAEDSPIELMQIVSCPFAEDLRDFQFPSLKSEKWKPSTEELDVVDELLDAFDLQTKEESEEDAEKFHFEPESTLNPYLQRLYRCLSHRALQPNAPLPTFEEDGQGDQRRGLSLAPRREMVSSSSVESSLSKVKSTFCLKKVVKRKAKRRGDEIFQDDEEEEAKKRKIDDGDRLSAVDLISSANGRPQVTAVGIADPIGDFNALISRSSSASSSNPKDAAFYLKQLLDASFRLVLSSSHASTHSRALSCIVHARRSAVDAGLHAVFNDFMRMLKTRLHGEGVGEFWNNTIEEDAKRGEAIDLITSAEVSSSDVNPADAKTIFGPKTDIQSDTKEGEEDEEDLFDML